MPFLRCSKIEQEAALLLPSTLGITSQFLTDAKFALPPRPRKKFVVPLGAQEELRTSRCILHQMGIDHERLTYRHTGRDFRLTDVNGEVIRAVLR